MKKVYKISEKVLSEFIGADFEIAQSNLTNQQNVTRTNVYDDDMIDKKDIIPQTTDKFVKQSRVPWYGRYMHGLNGYSYIGENVTIDDSNPDLSEKILPIETLDKYGESIIKTKVINLTKELLNLKSSLGDKDGVDIQLIVAKYMLNNIDFSDVSQEKIADLLK